MLRHFEPVGLIQVLSRDPLSRLKFKCSQLLHGLNVILVQVEVLVQLGRFEDSGSVENDSDYFIILGELWAEQFKDGWVGCCEELRVDLFALALVYCEDLEVAEFYFDYGLVFVDCYSEAF